MKQRFAIAVVVVAAVVGLMVWFVRKADSAAPPLATTTESVAPPTAPVAKPLPAPVAKPPAPDERDRITGHVLDAISHDGVPGAELTLIGNTGVSTFQTRSDGSFELSPPSTGSLELATITAVGYLPYTPDRDPTGVHLTLMRGHAVRGVTLLLAPAVEYHGVVVDAHGTPVAGAQVRVAHSPVHELAHDDFPAQWTTGRDGRFTFQAVEDAVLEATAGSARGTAAVDRAVTVVHTLRIQLATPTRATTITGHVRDRSGAPIPGAWVRGAPTPFVSNMPVVFATTGGDGAFSLAGVNSDTYDLEVEAIDHVRGLRGDVRGGSHDVEIILEAGEPLAGRVIDDTGAPIAQFMLIARRRIEAARTTVAVRSVVDPEGRFALRVPAGDYELIASTRGHAPSPATRATAGDQHIQITIGAGASVRGVVVSSDDHTPIANAWIARDIVGRDLPGRNYPDRDHQPQPIEPSTLSRPDGSFLLTGLAAGPLTLRVQTLGYRVQTASLTAHDGDELGPVTIELTPRGAIDPRHLPDEATIGVQLIGRNGALGVLRVLPDSGAAAAGIAVGDLILAVDGMSVATLGRDDSIDRIRGPAGTTVTLTLKRDDRTMQLIVERRRE